MLRPAEGEVVNVGLASEVLPRVELGLLDLLALLDVEAAAEDLGDGRALAKRPRPQRPVRKIASVRTSLTIASFKFEEKQDDNRKFLIAIASLKFEGKQNDNRKF